MSKYLLVAAVLLGSALAATIPGSKSFTDSPLIVAEGASEPAVSIAGNGTIAVSGLQWLFDPNFFGTHLWMGPPEWNMLPALWKPLATQADARSTLDERSWNYRDGGILNAPEREVAHAPGR